MSEDRMVRVLWADRVKPGDTIIVQCIGTISVECSVGEQQHNETVSHELFILDSRPDDGSICFIYETETGVQGHRSFKKNTAIRGYFSEPLHPARS